MNVMMIEVPEKVARVLDRLDSNLAADAVAMKPILRWNLHRIGADLWTLSELDDFHPDELDALAERLHALAEAYRVIQVG
jgi:hypothetical protein